MLEPTHSLQKKKIHTSSYLALFLMPHLCIYKMVNVVIDCLNDTLAIKISSHYYFHVSLFTQSYQEYLVDGENYMRVKFYIKGSNRKGTVHVDVKQVILVFVYFSKV